MRQALGELPGADRFGLRPFGMKWEAEENDMSKEKSIAVNPFFRELFQLGIYKRSQGRIARQVTFGVLAVTFALAAWRLWVLTMDWHPGQSLGASDRLIRGLVVGAFAFVGWWVSFRLVNMPAFADFLIAVEAEMNKVSWPTRTELIRSSLVVIFLMVFMAVLLVAYDFFWQWLLQILQVVK